MNIQIIFLVVTLSAVTAAKDVNHRVYNGKPVQVGELEHLVKIQMVSGSCSGSIIDPNWILTAAHCVYDAKPGERCKILHHSQSKPIAHATKSYYHPKYYEPDNSESLEPWQINVDLALIKVNTPIKFNENIQPIRLVNRAPVVNGKAFIAGYGDTNMVPPSQQPLKGSLRIVKCPRTDFKGMSVICTKDLVSSGRGDSGGPLMTKEGLIGVVSAGCTESCGRLKEMSYFANVADPGNLAWIQKVMGKK